MFMYRKIQYHQDLSSFQLDLHIPCDPNKNPSKLFCGYQQTDSKVYIEGQKTQDSQHGIKGEQSRMTYTAQLEDWTVWLW